MSDSKGKAVIGAFVVGAIALGVAAVLVLGGGDFLKKKLLRVMYFEGSVKGLKVGAPVVFQGVEIGSVKSISIETDPSNWTFKIPVIVELDPSAYRDPNLEIDTKEGLSVMIERGLRAKLELQSLVTGMLQIEIDFMPDTKARLVGGDTPYPEIPTVRSGMEKFARQLEDLPIKELIREMADTLVSIREVVGSAELRGSLQHLSETIQDVRQLVKHADAEVVSAASKLLNAADQMVAAIDEQIRPLLGKADKTIGDVDRLALDVNQTVMPLGRKLQQTADAITTTAEAIRPALKSAQRALANIESITREGSDERDNLDDALKELAAAARSIKNWADYLGRHPEALILGKGQPGQRR